MARLFFCGSKTDFEGIDALDILLYFAGASKTSMSTDLDQH